MIEIIGYALAVVIGLLLSLLGGGGSILTVPVLVYIFKIQPHIATAYSLLIVGISSLVGSAAYMKERMVSIKTAVFFSFPSFVMVFIMRKFIVPVIPVNIITCEDWVLTKNLLIMLLFALLMVLASISMIRSKKKLTENIEAITRRINYPMIFLEGLIVGSLTGFVGVGGGFLIIPVLTMFVNLPMKMAVGTSLMIIAINSCFGFLGDLGNHSINWNFLGIFISLSLAGVFIGSYLSKFVKNAPLKHAFGWFTLLTGIGILLRELIFS